MEISRFSSRIYMEVNSSSLHSRKLEGPKSPVSSTWTDPCTLPIFLLTPASTAGAQRSGLMDPVAGPGSKFLPDHPPPQQENSFSQKPQAFSAALFFFFFQIRGKSNVLWVNHSFIFMISNGTVRLYIRNPEGCTVVSILVLKFTSIDTKLIEIALGFFLERRLNT